MTRVFNKQDRVRVSKSSSTYFDAIGTVVEMDSFGYKVSLDGFERPLRFLDSELEKVFAPKLPMTHTLKYLKELDEDAQLLFHAADIYPRGTTLRADLEAFANHQAKIVGLLKSTLERDGVTLWEDEVDGK